MPDNETEIRVRFAPSPTGKFHIGNARTALFNWLFARKNGGRFIVRIEDTDVSRSEREYENVVLDGLEWMGLLWDEGPGVGGEWGPYRQSERIDIYESFLTTLKEKDLLYPCYCTEEELKRERERMLAARTPPRYSGKCRHLSEEEQNRLEEEGRNPAYRFKVPREIIGFEDIIHGPVSFKSDLIGDFIVLRSTGMPSYNFAVVVDDIKMKISHVIRGEDHLSNTSRQLMLYRAFRAEPPRFAHHAFLLGTDRTKLSKRHGAVSVEEFIRQGYIPEALNNYLAWLGGSLKGSEEIFTIDELIGRFSLGSLGKNAAVFEETKLRWMNSRHLKSLKPEVVYLLLVKRRNMFHLHPQRKRDRENEIRLIPHLVHNAETLRELELNLSVFCEKDIELSPEARDVLQNDEAHRVLAELKDSLKDLPENLKREDIQSVFKKVGKKTGAKGKSLYMPMRAALTGTFEGPELEKVFFLLDKSILIHRLESVLS
jgi:nondiscriminating glutamyl-tRNA synthetase